MKDLQPLSDAELSGLERAAAKADAGPWGLQYDGWTDAEGTHERIAYMLRGDDRVCQTVDGEVDANAIFIAAANPTTVLRLVAEVRALRWALASIARRYEAQPSRDHTGLAWAMASEAREALAGAGTETGEESEP